MSQPLLQIEGLKVAVGGKEVLRGVDLTIGHGETHVLFGPNGSGKSTLVMAIMGAPGYEITAGRILFNGQDITHLPTNERAKLGIGLAFQRPPAIKGVKLGDLLKQIGDGEAPKFAEELLLKEHLDRDVNLGFSGGEAKRSELLQLLVQRPHLVLLDEPESGVDLESMKLVGKVIKELLRPHPILKRQTSGLIITHTGYVLDYITADRGHVMLNGQIVCSGNPRDIFETIQEAGFERCKDCLLAKLKGVQNA